MSSANHPQIDGQFERTI